MAQHDQRPPGTYPGLGAPGTVRSASRVLDVTLIAAPVVVVSASVRHVRDVQSNRDLVGRALAESLDRHTVSMPLADLMIARFSGSVTARDGELGRHPIVAFSAVSPLDLIIPQYRRAGHAHYRGEPGADAAAVRPTTGVDAA